MPDNATSASFLDGQKKMGEKPNVLQLTVQPHSCFVFVFVFFTFIVIYKNTQQNEQH